MNISQVSRAAISTLIACVAALLVLFSASGCRLAAYFVPEYETSQPLASFGVKSELDILESSDGSLHAVVFSEDRWYDTMAGMDFLDLAIPIMARLPYDDAMLQAALHSSILWTI